jgi:hypothetical protein
MAGHSGMGLSSQLFGEPKHEDHDPGWPGHKAARPYLKNKQCKTDGRVAQAIEHIPSKQEALSLTSLKQKYKQIKINN